ncbi:hypothetical protein, partial [Acinetobacter parvus]
DAWEDTAKMQVQRLNPLSAGKSVQTMYVLSLLSLMCLNPLSAGKSVQTQVLYIPNNGKSLNPLSAGKSVQTLPSFFSFVKQRLIEAKYFKVCISKVAV